MATLPLPGPGWSEYGSSSLAVTVGVVPLPELFSVDSCAPDGACLLALALDVREASSALPGLLKNHVIFFILIFFIDWMFLARSTKCVFVVFFH